MIGCRADVVRGAVRRVIDGLRVDSVDPKTANCPIAGMGTGPLLH